MTTVRAAFYARVSSEQQAAAHTIESQISALTERARSDGTPVPLERQFVDDGNSGATLVRPALDRLRDLASVGAIDRLYVHSPDRLARNYAYQVLLLDEWRRARAFLLLMYSRDGEESANNSAWRKRIPTICGGSCWRRTTAGRAACGNWPSGLG